jgi:hypothetical protein
LLHCQLFCANKLALVASKDEVPVVAQNRHAYRTLRHTLYSLICCKTSFQPHCGPGVDSASNRNKYQVSSWG